MVKKRFNIFRLGDAPTNEDLDDEEAARFHRDIIKKKLFLKKLYLEFYNIFKENTKNIPAGLKIELGSGGGFLKEVIPDVITTDVIDLSWTDKVISAEKMPFENESVSAFFLLNTLHHIKYPNNFFSEIQRCLKKDGRVVMIEPTNSSFAKFFYKHFHHELFDEKKVEWVIEGEERLTDANVALPWIIFIRDKQKFQKKYADLKILKVNKHTPFRYVLSGGVSAKQLVPSASFSFFTGVENLLSPLNQHIGLSMTIILEKT